MVRGLVKLNTLTRPQDCNRSFQWALRRVRSVPRFLPQVPPSYRGRAAKSVQPLSLSSPARRTAHPGWAAAAGDCCQPGWCMGTLVLLHLSCPV